MGLAEAIALALGATGAVYVLAMLGLTFGMGRLRRGDCASKPFVSVVVAARNEEASLPGCLDALLGQDYPQDRLEFIVVDDRSEDRTPEIAGEYGARDPRLRVLSVGEARYACPKKNALALGISGSRGEILMTTDADCRPGPGWVSGMLRHFGPGVGMVAGHSPPLPGGGWLHGILALENLAKAGLAAGSIGLGLPLACTGRNLAFRREAFDRVGGYDRIGHIVAGDDVLLMRLMARRADWRIRYAAEPETAVPTEAGSARPRRLYHQKVRHASKALHYGAPILFPAAIVYLFHVLLIVGIPAAILSPAAFTAPWIALAVKGVVDLAFLLQAGRRLRGLGSLRFFPLLEIVYIPYVVCFSLIGSTKRFRWKTGNSLQ